MTRREAVRLYLKGANFRRVGRILVPLWRRERRAFQVNQVIHLSGGNPNSRDPDRDYFTEINRYEVPGGVDSKAGRPIEQPYAVIINTRYIKGPDKDAQPYLSLSVNEMKRKLLERGIHHSKLFIHGSALPNFGVDKWGNFGNTFA